VTLTWTPVSGASYYAVYQSTDSTWSDYIILTSSATSTTYTVSSTYTLTAGTTYYYKVGAKKQYSSDPVGELSESVAVYTGVSGITSITANALSESSIKITWNTVANASKYRVYRGTNSSSTSMEPVAYIDAPAIEYTDNSLAASTSYYYRIAVIRSGDSESLQSYNYAYATTRSAPTVTGIYASTLSESSIKVTWDAFTGASKYRVYRARNTSSSASMEPVAYVDTPATEYTDTSLAASTTYYYRIAVIYSDSREGPLSSDYSYATTRSAPTVTGISASALSGTSIKVTWNALTVASKYRVYRGLNTSSSTDMEPVAYIDAPATEYSDTSLLSGSRYYYRIAVIYSDNSEGPKSSDYDYAIPTTLPDNLTATANGRIITLEWDAVEGASTYYIYGALTQAGPYAFVDSFNASQGTVYNVTTLTQWSGVPLSGSTTYYFKVATINNGPMSNPANATTGP
jgi:fibronectin type 3 domain-containing protein